MLDEAWVVTGMTGGSAGCGVSVADAVGSGQIFPAVLAEAHLLAFRIGWIG